MNETNTETAVATEVTAEVLEQARRVGGWMRKNLRKKQFNLATADGAALDVIPAFPAPRNLSSEDLEESIELLEADADPSDAGWVKSVAKLRSQLVLHRERCRALLDVLQAGDVPDAAAFQAALETRSQRLGELFADNMRSVLKAQRPLETNVRSLCEFFLQSGLDGNCRAVYVVNGHAGEDEYCKELDEIPIDKMESDDRTEVHPMFGQVVGPDGDRFPVIFRPLEATNNIKDMASMIVAGQAQPRTRIKKTMQFYAHKGDDSAFVSLFNVSPDQVGREPQSLAPDVFGSKLAERYTDLDKAYRTTMVTANHVVGRPKTEFEDEDVLIYPNCLVSGQLYFQEYVDSRSNAFHGSAVRKDFAPNYGLDARWVDDQAELMGDVHISFLRTQDDYRGDGTASSFDKFLSAYAGKGTALNYVMGQHYLARVVRFHMLQNRGGDTTDKEAQRVGRALHERLKKLASDRDTSKYFVSAKCNWQTSRIVETSEGEKVQVHEVEVQFREGVHKFEISLTEPKIAATADDLDG